MPAIRGRVCYHPCEIACNRTRVDEPVRIHRNRRVEKVEIEKQQGYLDAVFVAIGPQISKQIDIPAHDFAAVEAKQEGVQINWLRSIRLMERDRIEVEVMTLDARAAPNRPAKLKP